jgi:choline dehydrogenase
MATFAARTWLRQDSAFKNTFDYIVVGAGSAGCIIASRLSEDPGTRVLLLEAGGSDRSLFIDMPAALPFVYQNKKIGWGYQSGPEPHLIGTTSVGKTIDEKMGKVLGGSTSINAMIYNRGNPMDYDGWAEDGLPDWDFAHVLPYFRKTESFSDGANEWRGGQGPVHISRCRAEHKLFDAFVQSGEQAGFPLTPDHNGYKQEGMHIAQAFIHQGQRWSSARAYLYPALSRPNLQVMKNTLVQRVIIENGTAVGIELSSESGLQRITCEREVILCAGAFNSPKLLMLSGIGDADELRSHGLNVLADVRAVGRNLQNHPGVDLQYTTRLEDSLVSQLSLFGRMTMGAQWLLTKRGLGTSNFFEAGAFLRTREDVAFPNMQFEFLPLTRVLKNGKLEPIPGFQLWMDLSRPESRGTVKLQSANPAEAPSIIFNHLESRQDMEDMIDGVRLARTLIRQPALDRFNGQELNPGSGVVSDAEIAAFVRQRTNTSYHPSGTCRMGSDAEAVVDSEAKVRAIKGLRVVDASIMPKVITGNLNAPVMMMAEKIADCIRGIALPPSSAGYYWTNR